MAINQYFLELINREDLYLSIKKWKSNICLIKSNRSRIDCNEGGLYCRTLIMGGIEDDDYISRFENVSS